jgi:hypothetical protein
MDYAVEETEPDVWRVHTAGAIRIVRFRRDLRTFAPWDICTADGRKLWASPSLESAVRWIQARTGHPTEALLVAGVLERTVANHQFENPGAAEIGAQQDKRQAQ